MRVAASPSLRCIGATNCLHPDDPMADSPTRGEEGESPKIDKALLARFDSDEDAVSAGLIPVRMSMTNRGSARALTPSPPKWETAPSGVARIPSSASNSPGRIEPIAVSPLSENPFIRQDTMKRAERGSPSKKTKLMPPNLFRKLTSFVALLFALALAVAGASVADVPLPVTLPAGLPASLAELNESLAALVGMAPPPPPPKKTGFLGLW